MVQLAALPFPIFLIRYEALQVAQAVHSTYSFYGFQYLSIIPAYHSDFSMSELVQLILQCCQSDRDSISLLRAHEGPFWHKICWLCPSDESWSRSLSSLGSQSPLIFFHQSLRSQLASSTFAPDHSIRIALLTADLSVLFSADWPLHLQICFHLAIVTHFRNQNLVPRLSFPCKGSLYCTVLFVLVEAYYFRARRSARAVTELLECERRPLAEFGWLLSWVWWLRQSTDVAPQQSCLYHHSWFNSGMNGWDLENIWKEIF